MPHGKLIASDNYLIPFHRGEETGFSWVFEKYYPGLCYYASRFNNNKQWVEDAVQDVFINLWNRREEFSKIESIQAYLYRSVANHCVNTLKRERSIETKEQTIEPAAVDSNTIYDCIVQSELYNKVYGLIEGLPPVLSEVVNLYYLEGKGVREIASILNIPVFTVKSRRQRAIIKLRQMLPGYFRFFILLFSSWLFS